MRAMTRYSRRRSPTEAGAEDVDEDIAPSSSSRSLASMIAADWEDAMLHSCISTDDGDSTRSSDNIRIDTRPRTSGGKRRPSNGMAPVLRIRRRDHQHQESDYEDEDDINDYQYVSEEEHNKTRRMMLVPSDDTSTVFEDDESIFSSESDISLCRPGHRRIETTNSVISSSSKIPTAPVNGQQQAEEDYRRYPTRDPLDGECSAVNSLASLFLGQDCNLEFDERSPADQRTTLGVNYNKTNTPLAQANQLLKKSSLKQVSSIGCSGGTPTSTTSSHSSSMVKSSSSSKPSVSFATVNFREYDIALSQNPSCSEGPPIELGWKFQEQEAMPVEHYEEYKSKQFPRRRRLQELVLSDTVRRRMLLQRYTPDELAEAVREVEQLKRQRVMTYLLLPASTLDEAAEEVYRYMMRVFTKNS